MDNYVYEVGSNLYINLTNQCSNSCVFCIRNGREGMNNTPLWLKNEPAALDVIVSLEKKDLTKYGEVVFCGFGEPTYNLDALIEVGKYLVGKGKKVRLNTNGHGNKINGRDITPLLVGAVNEINVSLNASSAQQYNRECNCIYGEEGFFLMLDFAKACKKNGIKVVLSVVDVVGDNEIEKCKQLAAKHNLPLRVRKFE